MAELTLRNIVIAGLVKAALDAVALNDTFDNDGKTYLEIANASGGTLTVTINGQVSFQHGVSATKTVSIPTGETHLVGPFPERFYNTDGANEVSVDYSTITSVTAAAFSVRDIHA
jgi:hypothetical protein